MQFLENLVGLKNILYLFKQELLKKNIYSIRLVIFFNLKVEWFTGSHLISNRTARTCHPQYTPFHQFCNTQLRKLL